MCRMLRPAGWWVILALVTACSAQPATEADAGTSVDAAQVDSGAAVDGAAGAGTLTLAFGADFARGTGCRAATVDTLNAGCDIYSATLDIASGTVSNVMRLTTADEPELFPAIARSNAVYFNVYAGTAQRIGYAVNGQVGQLLVDANHPSITADGNRIVYGDTKAHKLMAGDLSADGKLVANAKALTGEPSQFEPEIAGDHVIFYQEFPGGAEKKNAQGRLYSLTTKLTIDFTDADGSAHCTLSPLGTLGTCNNASAGGIRGRTITGETLGELKTVIALKSPSEMAKIDPAYASCTAVSFNYPAFCGDDAHVVLSAACGVGPGEHGSNGTFSKLFLVNLSGATPQFTPIGDELARQFGGPGKDAMTAACR